MADYQNQTPTTPSQPPRPNPYTNPDKGNGSNVLKIVTIVLAIALVACLGVLYSVWNTGKENVEIVTIEKEQVTNELVQMRAEYDDLRTNNDTLNSQLNLEKQKIDLLLEKIKSTDASNRKKIKEYERELGTLRSIMRGYIGQIDSLNAVNQQLRNENTEIREKVNQSQKKYEELSQKTDNLKSMVAKGSSLKLRDIMVTGLNSRDKENSRAKQITRMRTCFTIIGNNIADKGARTLYIRVKGPDGSLLTNSSDNLFDVETGSQLVYSALREVDYQGDDLEVCIFYADNDFMSGAYSVEVYLGGTLMGSSQILLK